MAVLTLSAPFDAAPPEDDTRLAGLAGARSPTRDALVVEVEPLDAAVLFVGAVPLDGFDADDTLEEPFDAAELLLAVTLSSFSKFGIAYPFRV